MQVLVIESQKSYVKQKQENAECSKKICKLGRTEGQDGNTEGDISYYEPVMRVRYKPMTIF